MKTLTFSTNRAQRIWFDLIEHRDVNSLRIGLARSGEPLAGTEPEHFQGAARVDDGRARVVVRVDFDAVTVYVHTPR